METHETSCISQADQNTMKHSDKSLDDRHEKLQFLPGIEHCPQEYETVTLTTAPISLTCTS